MKRAEKKTANRAAAVGRGSAGALMVPHGCAEAGRDFECAFEVLQRDDRARDLWHRDPAKRTLPRAS